MSIDYNDPMTNYYQTLGLDESASQDDIKKTYRTLAMKWHPDRNPGNQAAEAKFKEISQAYEILGDEQKRQQYDQQRQGGANPFANSHFEFRSGNMSNNPFGDIFEQMFGAQGFGFRPTKNPDLSMQLGINLEDAFTGKSVPVQFNDSAGNRVNLVITIPPGVDSGARIKYAGNGNRDNPSLPPGDLYVTILVADHSVFQRDGAHLIMPLNVNLWDTIIGTTQTVVTIDKQSVLLKIPALTKDQTVLRIKEKGMPMRASGSPRGDLLVKINTILPDNLSNDQINLIKTWAGRVDT